MKVIQIVSYFPPHLGGMELRVKELTEKLAKKGHKVEVFTSDIGCPKDKQLKSTKNLKINYLPAWEFAHTPIIPSLFSRLMKIPKNSIMHLHIAQALTPEIVWLVSKIRKIPYITHIRGNPEISGRFGFLLAPYKKLFLRKVLIDSNKIISLNEDYKNIFSKMYNLPKKKIITIPNATTFEPINKIRIRPVKNILFVGRLSMEKNILKLVESFSLLKNKNITLNIVGEGEKRDEIEQLIKKKKLKNITLHGRKEKEELINIYKSSDIFILPSEYECFSSTLLEAMATGTPIIASNVLGTRNIIKDNYNGLLVKPTPKGIAKAIEKLTANPKLRQRLAKNGLKEVKKYSWNKIVKQTEDVYKEVLEEHAKKNKK